MQFTLLFTLVALIQKFAFADHNNSALCKTWNDAKGNFLKEMSEFHVTCTNNEDCSGLKCSGVAYGNDIDSMIQLYACENPPSVEFQVNVPKLDVNNFKKRIYHNDSVTLNQNLKVEFELERRNKELIFGLYVHLLYKESFPLLRTRFPVISPVEFPVECGQSESSTRLPINENEGKNITKQSLTASKVSVVPSHSVAALVSSKNYVVRNDGNRSCSIINTTCSEEEICKQIHRLKPDGICVCNVNYTRDVTGKCIYGQPKETSSVALLLTAVLVPIFAILLIVGAVFVSIQLKVCTHLRRRLRVQVYEHVLLGDEEEEEEDLRNPVA